MIMRKTLILMFACMCLAFSANAQRNSGRLSLVSRRKPGHCV